MSYLGVTLIKGYHSEPLIFGGRSKYLKIRFSVSPVRFLFFILRNNANFNSRYDRKTYTPATSSRHHEIWRFLFRIHGPLACTMYFRLPFRGRIQASLNKVSLSFFNHDLVIQNILDLSMTVTRRGTNFQAKKHLEGTFPWTFKSPALGSYFITDSIIPIVITTPTVTKHGPRF